MNSADENELKAQFEEIVSRIEKIIKTVSRHYPETTATRTGENSATESEETELTRNQP